MGDGRIGWPEVDPGSELAGIAVRSSHPAGGGGPTLALEGGGFVEQPIGLSGAMVEHRAPLATRIEPGIAHHRAEDKLFVERRVRQGNPPW